MPFILLVSVIFSNYFYFTVGKQPGYVSFEPGRQFCKLVRYPKGSDKEEKENSETEIFPLRNKNPKEKIPDFEIQENEDTEELEMGIPEKRYCTKCDFVQEHRTKHCRSCEACVAKDDHHCFWIGGCVGELNHGTFYLLLLSLTTELCLAFFYVHIMVILGVFWASLQFEGLRKKS